MRKTIVRRIRRLEDLQLRCQPESGPSLADIFIERRRKRALAEGREPDPPSGQRMDSRARHLSLADVLLENRKARRP